MIKLESKTMTKAIATAKTVRPRVRCTGERTYAVTGRRGAIYTVRFIIVNGLRLAECSCPAPDLCYHIPAAAALNIALHSIYAKPSDTPKTSDSRAELISEIEQVWQSKHPHHPIGDALLKRFGTNNLESLANGFLAQIRAALA